MAVRPELRDELLNLPADERQELASELSESLDDEPQKRVDELVRRARAVRDGTAELVDGDEARRRVLARLRELRSE